MAKRTGCQLLVGSVHVDVVHVEQQFLRQRNRILNARCAMPEATEVMYDAIEERIDALVARTTFPCPYVIVMGGILINSDHDIGSLCSFRRLSCIHVPSQRRDDWLPEYLEQTSAATA